MPRWFAAVVAGGATGVAGAGIIGLLLAVAGLFAWPLALAAGVVAGAGGALVAWRSVPDAGSHVGAAAALVVAVAFVAGNWSVVGGSVVLERDPGLYSATARWIDGEGSLEVDARVGPFAAAPAGELSFVSVGMYDRDGTTLEFQANHLAPVLFAIGHGAGGAGGMQRVPLLLVAGALLAVYALAVRVTGRDWAAVAGIVALAICLPVLGAARDTLSEPVVLLLLWAGLWLWTVAADSERPAAALLAGLCLGACLATRIDAAAYLVPVPVPLALHGRRAGWRVPGRVAAGLVPGVLAAVLDVGLRSRGYIGDLEVEVVSLYALLGVAVVVGVVVARWRRPVRVPSSAATVVAGVVVVALVAAWLVRPFVQTALASDSVLVSSLQRARGDEVDGRRRYHELSMVWQAWYLGPFVLAAAVAGAGLLVRRLRGVLLLPVAALGAGTALYLFRPAIAPDHLWAMRRFVPAALPLWCVLAGVALVWVADALPRRRAGIVAALLVLAFAPIVARTWPVRAFREQDGFLAIVERTCDVVGPDGAVVVPEESTSGQTLSQTMRSWCDVPVALLTPSAGASTVRELAAAWADEGRELWVVADVAEQLATYVPAGGSIVELGPVASDRFLHDTLTSPPYEYERIAVNAVATRAVGG